MRILTAKLAGLVLFSFLVSSFALLIGQPAVAAPPASTPIDGIECRFSMYRTEYGEITSSVNAGGSYNTYRVSDLDQSAIDAMLDDPELEADYNSLIDRENNGDATIILVLDAVSAIGDNQDTCRQPPSIMFSRPSTPSEFVGFRRSSTAFQRGTLSVNGATATISFPQGSRGTVSYNVGGDTSLFSNPIFTDAGTNIGFCSDLEAVGGYAYSSCITPTFTDFNTISYRGERYLLEQWQGNDDSNLRYVLEVGSSPYEARRTALASCGDRIPFFTVDNDGGRLDEMTADGGNRIKGIIEQLGRLESETGTQGIRFRDADLLCNEIDEGDLQVGGLTNIRLVAQYFDAQKQVSIIAQGTESTGDREAVLQQIYTQDAADATVFYAANIGDCGDPSQRPSITFDEDPTGRTSGTLNAGWYVPNIDDNCSAMGPVRIIVRSTAADSGETPEGSTGGGGADAGSTENDPPEKTCSSEGGGLGWIICPVLIALDAGTIWLEDKLAGFLFIDQAQFDREGQGEGLYRAWSTLRGIATVIIVIIALVMIFSQAMGDGAFDNYSVKKLLPRLLMAGIAIQLSWFLMTQLINVFNILGDGIGGIMLSPFRLPDGTSLQPDTKLWQIFPEADSGAQVSMVAIVIAGGFALVGAIVPLAIGIISALLVAFITLIVRNIIVFLGVVFAPVAIAMSVLPGTQKTSKWWWESLEKALLMYPIVMALLAAGKIVSYILMQSGDGQLDSITSIAAIAAWYAPFFFLPKALQAGGSALGKVSGLAGDKSKGMFDKARQAADARKKYKGAAAERRAFAGQKSWYEKGGKFNPVGGAIGVTSRNLRKGGVYARSGGYGLTGDDKNLRQKIAQGAQAGYEKEQAEVAQQAWSVAGTELLRDRKALAALAQGQESVTLASGKVVTVKGMSDVGKGQMSKLAAESLVSQRATGDVAKLMGYDPDTGDFAGSTPAEKAANRQRGQQFFQSPAWQHILATKYGDVNETIPQFTDSKRAFDTEVDSAGRTRSASVSESAKSTAKSMSTWKKEQFAVLSRDFGSMDATEQANVLKSINELVGNENYKGGIVGNTDISAHLTSIDPSLSGRI